MSWIYDPACPVPPEVLPAEGDHGLLKHVVLCCAGTITRTSLDIAPWSAKAAATWIDRGYEIHAMIDCLDGKAFAASDDATFDEYAMRIGDLLSERKDFAGVHFDIEPYLERHSLFYAKVRSRLKSKPLGVAIAHWSDSLFKSADYIVLMGYDRNSNPETVITPDEFRADVTSYYRDFALNARKHGAPYLVGVPAVATHCEFETKLKPTGETVKSGFGMEAYLDAALDAVNQPDIAGAPEFRGLAIWALLNEPVGRTTNHFIEPHDLTPPVRARLNSWITQYRNHLKSVVHK